MPEQQTKNRRFVLINVFIYIIILFAKQHHLNQTIHHKLIFLSWSLPSLTSLNWIVTMAWTEVSRDFLFCIWFLFQRSKKNASFWQFDVWNCLWPNEKNMIKWKTVTYSRKFDIRFHQLWMFFWWKKGKQLQQSRDKIHF